MAKYKRIKGGEKNQLTGKPFTRNELHEVGSLYIEMNGQGIHENNPKIHILAEQLGRTVRSVENQLLGFRAHVTSKSGRTNYNTLIPEVWQEINIELKKNTVDKNNKPNIPKDIFDEFKFRISSQLKTILGKNLITDDYVAIFELVKNSFDAHADNVKIIFDDDKIIIWDDGKGMNRRDIIDKWLFIAYSAKNEGTEDIEFDDEKNSSYRNKINSKRLYAGAKGIGRFSADRLGSKLKLTSRKINDPIYWELSFDWDKYELDSQDEFKDIDIDHNKLEKTEYFNFQHGVILEISDLRTVWPRTKILNLKRSLEKLINPFQIEKDFNIEILCEMEREKDIELLNSDSFELWQIVNGPVGNFLFDTLNINTTQIKSYVGEDDNEDFIITELIDRGNLIYKTKEANKFSHIPIESNIHLYYLNQGAKANFTKLMGLTTFEFGSIFLFNNGFRVLPFGEPNHDPFEINQRKAQGYSRNLGARELIGQVSISKSTEQFQETSSRDGGLIDTPGTRELKEFFMNTLVKLENYVEPILWKIKRRSGNGEETLDTTAKTQIIDFVSNISEKSNIQLLDYSDKLLSYINENTEFDSLPLFNKLRLIAEQTGDIETLSNINDEEKKYKEEVKKAEEKAREEERKRQEAEEIAKEEARKREEAEEIAREEATKRAEADERTRKYQEALNRSRSAETIEYKDLRDSNHLIGVYSDDITKKILLLKRKLDNPILASKDNIISILQGISLANEKISTLTRFTTKANFLEASLETNEDIVNYIRNYIETIYVIIYPDVNIQIITNNIEFTKSFKPIELCVVLDNVLSNSRRKNAEKIILEFSQSQQTLDLSIKDIGAPLDSSLDGTSIFEEGITTTKGSGLGLSHVRRVMKDDLNGDVIYNSDYKNGFELILKFKK